MTRVKQDPALKQRSPVRGGPGKHVSPHLSVRTTSVAVVKTALLSLHLDLDVLRCPQPPTAGGLCGGLLLRGDDFFS